MRVRDILKSLKKRVENFGANVGALLSPETRADWLRGFVPNISPDVVRPIRNIRRNINMIERKPLQYLQGFHTPSFNQAIERTAKAINTTRMLVEPKYQKTFLRGFTPNLPPKLYDFQRRAGNILTNKEYFENVMVKKVPQNKIGAFLYKQFVYNPQTKKFLPMSILHKINEATDLSKQYEKGLITKRQYLDRLGDITSEIAIGGVTGGLGEVGAATKGTKLAKVVSKPTQSEQRLLAIEQKPGQLKIKMGEKLSSLGDYIKKVQNRLDKLYTEAVDRFHPLSKIAKKAGNELEMQDALTGYYGAGSTADYHINFELAPILKKHDLNILKKAAIALRDLELAGRKIKGSPQQKQAKAILEELKQQVGDDGFKQLMGTLDELYKYQQNILKKYLVDTGVLSDKTFKKIVSSNKKYIPFKRVSDKLDELLGLTPPTRGAGSVSKQDVVFKIKGSEKELRDPIEVILENTYKAVSLGRRQEVAKTIVSLKDKLPKGIIEKLPKPPHDPRETISLFENGKKVWYRVPQEVADAARGLSEEQLNTLVKILQKPTAVFRATATGVNPEFALPNIARDLQSAFVNAGLNPLNWVKGLAHLIKQDDVYKEFLMAGGKTSRVRLDEPVLKQTVADITSKKGLTIKKPSDILRVMQILGEYSEQPTRIAVFEREFKRLIKAGLDKETAARRAAYMAQEATTNFARRGSKTQSINAIYAFLNARLQGTDRLLRSLKKDPVKTSFRIGLSVLAPTLMLRAWNSRFKSYNDPRVISDRTKRDNFIIMLSDTPLKGGIQYIKIPKGDIGKLANPVEEFIDYALNRGGDVAKSIKETLLAFSPIDNWGGLIPTAIRPPIEVGVNKSFYYNYPIVPEYKKSYPAKYQDSYYTSPVFRMIGQKLNVSPAKLQHIAEGYGTGLVRIGEMLTQPLIPKKYVTPKNIAGATINRTPVLRRLLGGARMSKQEFIKSMQSKEGYIKKQIGSIRNAIKRGEIPMEDGVKQIKKLQEQLETTKKQQLGTINNDVMSLAIAYGYDKYLTHPAPYEGKLKQIKFERNKLNAAVRLLDDDRIPDEVKPKLIQQLGYKPEDIEYESLTRLRVADRVEYLASELKDLSPQQRVALLAQLAQKESLTGRKLVTRDVLKGLRKKGLISENDYYTLRSRRGRRVRIRVGTTPKLHLPQPKPVRPIIGKFRIKTPQLPRITTGRVGVTPTLSSREYRRLRQMIK